MNTKKRKEDSISEIALEKLKDLVAEANNL